MDQSEACCRPAATRQDHRPSRGDGRRAGTAGEGESPDGDRSAGGLYLAEIFDAATFHRPEEAGGHADRFTGCELGLDFVNDVGIRFCLLGEQDHVRIDRKPREDVHGDADHAQVVMEKLLAGGMIRSVGLDPEWLADTDQHVIHVCRGCRRRRRRSWDRRR